ncbi:acetyl-CoA C-acyltransferase [Arthrobacter sp. W4I7]|uniref:thiolase family protein n=1 Tax=Arthrobacter sp. W4I7 TaxID=3042296 RepID=UPI002786372A|nr:acetyl-CoA C-acyltransferase [Arthrobacter sp. W4I7]MDQ0691385.1 acetyl-CoA acyltransferase [Arthrobacter sp. W4I7]
MRDAVIVNAVRTPVGKRNGGLAQVHPADLSAHVLRALAARTDLDPGLVDDVVWGCVQGVDEQSACIARTAVLSAGWPETVPGVTLDRQCGSSQQSVHFAAAGLIAGHYDVVVAGGVESMSRIPLGSGSAGGNPWGGEGWAARYGEMPNQGLAAELIADKWQLSRQQLDEFAVLSHAKADAAQAAGAFDAEIVPVQAPGGLVRADEGIRPGSTVEKLGTLTPAFKEDGKIHAGNSSQISDAAAGLLMMTTEKARQLGLTPLARVHTATVAAANPIEMLTAPIPATEKALKRAGLTISDIDLFEVNEAFASVPMAWLAETGADPARLNIHGGAIALGHPLGGSGARLMTTLLSSLQQTGGRFGLQTMCEGGGQANATIIEMIR